jgi:hypothetical protein
MNKSIEPLFMPIMNSEVEWRYLDLNQAASNTDHIVVPYLTASALRIRLDRALGRENWTQSFREIGEGAVCSLSIRIDGEWITKEDGADLSEGNHKSMLTRAFCRAAAAWGIGRDLYDLPVFHANYVVAGTPGCSPIRFGEQTFYHLAPSIAVASPAALGPASTPQPQQMMPKPPARQPRVNIQAPVRETPTFIDSPLGSRAKIEEIKASQAPAPVMNPVSHIPRVYSVQSKSWNNPVTAEPTKPEGDLRPFAVEKIRFGHTKGKRLKDHTRDELAGLVHYFTNVLPEPSAPTVKSDKQRLIAFLGGKLEMPGEVKKA